MSSAANYDLSALVTKLASIATLSEAERQAILKLPATTRAFDAHQDIVRDKDCPSECCLILEGWAYRYKLLDEGGRQILSLHVPGDVPDLQSLHLRVMDHSLATLSPCRLAFIPHEGLRVLTRDHPGVAALLWRDTLVDAAIFREWIINLGQRSSPARIAHLFCEMYVKLHAVGLAQDHAYDFPLKQGDLADALGITNVHVNRVLKDVRRRGLITLQARRLVIHDWPALAAMAGFDPSYLHLEKPPTSSQTPEGAKDPF
ncbi:MAG TPA: Crp/Fnr family transcriptional regulator [Methylobacterium sp.]|jgi:CRP-like cAMP-binding protein